MKVEKYYRQVMFDVLNVCQLISAVLASTWKGKAVGGGGGGGGGGVLLRELLLGVYPFHKRFMKGSST